MGFLSIENGNILTSIHGGEWFKGTIRINKISGLIEEMGPNVKAHEGDEIVDMTGYTLTPGLVVGHHHLYSSLARGMPAPKQNPTNFPETLEYIWWVLDRALDEETVYLSTVAGLAGAARMGITGIVDHHASPNFISGSLKTMAKGFEEFGMRGMLCYEVTDRNGDNEGKRGVEENKDFAKYAINHPLLRAAVGGHASFTINDSTLDDMANLCDSMSLPLHIHLLEDKSDETISIKEFGMSPVSRLKIRNFFNPGDIIVHGVHLSDAQLKSIVDTGAQMVYNPRSNMNNRVGKANISIGNWALGTDGIDSDILTEARTCFFRGRENNPPIEWDSTFKFLKQSQNLLGYHFGLELGHLKKGSAADITVLDYDPPTPMDSGNFSGHLAFGLSSWSVDSTMVAGKWVLRHKKLVTVDEAELMAKTREGAVKLYKKMEG
jgi:putative selenium metabolism protein SsnA